MDLFNFKVVQYMEATLLLKGKTKLTFKIHELTNPLLTNVIISKYLHIYKTISDTIWFESFFFWTRIFEDEEIYFLLVQDEYHSLLPFPPFRRAIRCSNKFTIFMNPWQTSALALSIENNFLLKNYLLYKTNVWS